MQCACDGYKSPACGCVMRRTLAALFRKDDPAWCLTAGGEIGYAEPISNAWRKAFDLEA
jgi:hypothetical protein